MATCDTQTLYINAAKLLNSHKQTVVTMKTLTNNIKDFLVLIPEVKLNQQCIWQKKKKKYFCLVFLKK